jgi:putative transposase
VAGRHQYGNVLDIFVQSWRNKAATIKFFRKLLKRGIYVPRVLITDTLASYEAAKKEVMVSVEHRRHRRLNTRAEHSHQPMRQRERTMRCFTSAGQPSDSCPPSDRSTHTFAHVGTWLKAKEYRRERTRRFQVWNEVVSFQNAVSAIISRADDYSTAT